MYQATKPSECTNCSGCGLIAYVRSNLPTRRRPDLELDYPIETIVLGVTINNRKWAIVGAYRSPSYLHRAWTKFQRKLTIL